MRIKFLVLNTELKGHQFETDKDSLRVGRSRENDFVLKQKSVSRVHAMFSVRDGRVILEDIGSRNRTEVNGERLSGPTPVGDGDVISFGDVAVQVILPDRAASAEEEDAEVTPEAGVAVPAPEAEEKPPEQMTQEAPAALAPREKPVPAPSVQPSFWPAVAPEAGPLASPERAVPVPPALWPALALILGVTVTVLLVSYFLQKGGADAPDAITGVALRVDEDKVIQVRRGYINRPYVEHSDIVEVARTLNLDMAVHFTGKKVGVTTVRLYNDLGRYVEIHVNVLPRPITEVKKVFIDAARTDEERIALAIEDMKRGEVMEDQNDPYEAMLQYKRALAVLAPFATRPNREYNEATNRLKRIEGVILERYDLLMRQAGDFVRDGDKPMAIERLAEIQKLIPDTKDVRRQNADLLMDMLNRMQEAEKRHSRSGL